MHKKGASDTFRGSLGLRVYILISYHAHMLGLPPFGGQQQQHVFSAVSIIQI